MSSPESPAMLRQAELAEALDRVYHLVDDVLVSAGVDALDESTIQRLNTLGSKLYAARREQGAIFPPVIEGALNATEVAVTVMAMLQAVNLDVFELSVWRRWAQV